MSLAALQALPSLAALVLEIGIVTQVEAIAVQLTRLQLKGCTAACTGDYSCLTPLVQLALQNTEALTQHWCGCMFQAQIPFSMTELSWVNSTQ